MLWLNRMIPPGADARSHVEARKEEKPEEQNPCHRSPPAFVKLWIEAKRDLAGRKPQRKRENLDHGGHQGPPLSVFGAHYKGVDNTKPDQGGKEGRPEVLDHRDVVR